MSTILNTNGAELNIPQIDKRIKGNFYVITAQWNENITGKLRNGAVETLKKGGVDQKQIIEISVPGTVELVNAAALALKGGVAAGIIVIGCVIRGDTPHFDYVCQIAAQGIATLNAEGGPAVIFGVLTVNTMEQALERAGGILGNKGSEAGVAALEMANIRTKFWFC